MPAAIAIPRVATSSAGPMRALVFIGAALACLSLLAIASPAGAEPVQESELPTADELVERYIDAVGGRDAIERLRTRVAELRLVTDLEWDRHIYEVDTLSVYGRSSGEYLVVTKTPDGVIIEGFDGDEDWKIDPDGLVRSDNPRVLRDTWMTDPQFPLKLKSMYPTMRSTGIEKWNEDTVYVVDVGDGESHRLGFDPETGLLIRLGYHIWLQDYREVDGVLMPHRVIHGRKGGSSTFEFGSVAHNEKLDRTIFSLAK